MTDCEKVIKGLHQHCEGSMFNRCGECPYYEVTDEPFQCRDALLMDVLDLLQEQKKAKVVFGRCKDGSFATECGNCGMYLDKAYSIFPKCNKELDWNSNQN